MLQNQGQCNPCYVLHLPQSLIWGGGLRLPTFIFLALSATAQTQYFADVGVGSQYYNATTAMYGLKITSGCLEAPARFCPTDNLTRGQMAVFIIRAWSLRLWGDPEAFRTYAPPSGNPYFADLTNTSDFQFPYVQKMLELGITNGCLTGPLRFCPWDTALNAHIAVFTTRARTLSDSQCTSPCSVDGFQNSPSPYFSDVPQGHDFFKWIQRLADLGAVSTC